MGPDDVVPDEEREVEPVFDDLDPGAQNPPVDLSDAAPDDAPDDVDVIADSERPV